MTIIYTFLKYTVITLLLLVNFSAHANEIDVCAPFKEAQVDKQVLKKMLQAASEGDLYRINQKTTRMGFCIDSPLGVVKAEFQKYNGGLALNDFFKQGSSLVQIDVDSLTTDSGFIETMLKGESFFDSETYPDIIFVSSGIEWINDEKAVLQGELTLRGITKTVAFYVTLSESLDETGNKVVSINATTTIQRSEFGMYTLSSLVGDRVSLCMTIDTYNYQS